MSEKNRIKSFISIALVSLSTALLQGCNQTIDARQTKEINGLIYKLNADDPFTGTVTHYPLNELLNVGDCELHTKKGQLDGTFTCTTNNGTKVSEIEFTNGKRDGTEKKWDMNTGKLVMSIHWKGGAKDGREEIFDAATGKTLRITNWSSNQKDGEEKAWDATGAQLLVDLDWKNGRQTGYAEGGQFRYKNGLLDGTMDRRHGLGGSLIRFKDGKRVGLQQKWDQNGQLLEEAQYNDDGVVQSWKEQTWYAEGKIATSVSLVNPSIANNSLALVELVKDGKEQRWDEKDGRLSYEVTWDKGKPLKGFASNVCSSPGVQPEYCKSYFGVFDPNKNPAIFGMDMVKDGLERIVDGKGQLIKEITWAMGVPSEAMSPEDIERNQRFGVTYSASSASPLNFNHSSAQLSGG